jgi:uncharacterized cupin superfamily protein
MLVHFHGPARNPDVLEATMVTSVGTETPFAVSNIAAEGFVPFVEDGHELGLVHWLREEDVAKGGVATGIWRADPDTSACDFEYIFSANETFHVLEGSVLIELVDGETLEVGPGDIAAFRKGTVSHWKVQAPFKKFFVIS